jgi:hypothetical protein
MQDRTGRTRRGYRTALRGRRAVAVTDSRVRELHGDRLPHLESIDITASESEKTLDTVTRIYDSFLESGWTGQR